MSVGARLVLLLLAAAAAQEDADQEARAQKALTDMLTDALAMLKHGSAHAKEEAAAGVARMAVETTISQPFHPITFRNACVHAGVVDELVKLLVGEPSPSTPRAKLHALEALEAIATDDPSTDLDNGHALAVCSKTGAVAAIVPLLAADEESLQMRAASCAAVLAENPACQTKLLKQKVVAPLVELGKYGGDGAKLQSIAALEMLALNNPAAVEAIAAAGGVELIQGLHRVGGPLLKEATETLLGGISAPAETRTVAVDAKAHARQAHSTRLKHSKVWQSATGQGPMRRAISPAEAARLAEEEGEAEEEEEEEEDGGLMRHE